MSKELTAALITGLLTSGLFMIVFGIGLGFIFMFLPTLPLFHSGLGPHARMTHIAVFSAALLIGIVAGLSAATVFFFFLGLPAWYMARRLVMYRPTASGDKEWFPVGLIVMNMTLWACGFVAMVTLFYATQPEGLPQILSANIHEAFSDLQEEYGEMIDTLANAWSFLIFPITIWLWCIILYAHAWVANRMLSHQGLQLRPDIGVHMFTIPSWMLTLLAIAALASLVGSPTMGFLGKSTLISLLLPYFFLGCVLMHQSGKTWPSGRFFLFFVYFMVFTQFWPALILSGIGVWYQIKHLSSAGTSSKS